MPVNHDHSPSLSTAAEGDIVGYSAISPAAIVALVLGLASFFAIGNLLWLILPALAIVAALMALAQIARSDGSISGRWAAVAGLSLALLFASTSIARSVSRAMHLRSSARTLADEWLELVRRGQLEQAHQWHLPAEERQNPGVSLAQFYHDSKPAKEALDSFFQTSPLSHVVAAPPEAKLQFDRVVEQLSLEKNDRVAMLYTLTDGGHETEFVVVTEYMRNKRNSDGHWQIPAVVFPKTDAAIP
jgi:hypothetical protein